MKIWLRNILEVLAIILVLPQVFIVMYYFRYLFLGDNWLGLLKTLSLYALTISWVSAPYLAVVVVAVKKLISVRVSWYVTLLLCVAAGYAWVAAWNVFIFKVFSYFWAALPILLCSIGFAGYAAARVLYLESLEPLKLEKAAGDEPE